MIMSTMPSKVDVQVAVPNKSRKFFTQDHLTTHTFMKPRPIFSREYVPNRNMSVMCDSYIRCNPMPVPIFGHAKVHNRAFFVPFRTVMPDFNEFYTQTMYNYSATNPAIPNSVPTIDNKELVRLFTNSISSPEPLLFAGTSASHDIVYYDVSTNPATTSYYLFSPLGLDYMTILESLGYKINWTSNDSFKHSALPLMCYCKVMVDWYFPSSYVGSSVYNFVQRIFTTAVHNRALDNTELLGLMQVTNSISYNPDYFVNAWDNPTGPNSINFDGSYSIKDISNNVSITQSVTNDPSAVSSPNNSYRPSNGTPFVGSNYTTTSYTAAGVTTQYIIDALKSLTDFTKRHQLSGVRTIDRYLAELGINLSSEILQRSMYLGSQDFDMEFFDVFSHSDTLNPGNGTGAVLGAYAGKGNGFSGKKTFDFENGQEFGMFIIVNSIIPVIGYYQGQHRETMHVNCLDFYHGDFDHMAVQPISTRELYVTQDGSVAVSGYGVDSGQGLNSTIFGYAPKYIEYNTPMDLTTGLYRAKTQQGLLPLYSMMRDLHYFEQGTLANMKHSVGFVLGEDAGQYNRIFYLDKAESTLDQMNAVHHFEVTYVDSTLPAYDTYDFDENNRNVKLDVNGSKLN